MQTIVIIIHLMVVVALVGVVLVQRSEGGGLGIGGGSGFMTARGASNALTRTTAILATAFFLTSLGLSLLARYGDKPIDILDRLPASTTQEQGTGGKGVLDQLGGESSPAPSSSTDEAPSAPAPAENSTTTGNAAAPAQTAPSDTGTPPQTPDAGAPESQIPTGQ